MKVIIIFLSVLLFSIKSYSQGINSKAIEIVNNYDTAYSEIVGTNLEIILPDEFIESNSFNGFINLQKNISLMISEIPGDVYKNFMGFDKHKMLTSGTIIGKETFYLINGYDALFIEGLQVAYGKKYIKLLLIIGNIYQTYLITATIPEEYAKEYYDQVKKSILSIIYNPNKEFNRNERFDFTVDVSNTILKESNFTTGSLIFTDDGNAPSESDDKTSYSIRKKIINKHLTDEAQINLIKKISELYPLAEEGIIRTEPQKINVNGAEGYEMYTVGLNESINKPELIYVAVIFDKNFYYTITGMTYGDIEKSLELFKKVTPTLKSR